MTRALFIPPAASLLAGFLLVGSPLTAAPAAAEPELYRVVGIGRGDQLNIRDRPDANAEIIGRIPPNARRIAGFGCTDDTPSRQAWCRVKYNGVVGWVRETFIRYN